MAAIISAIPTPQKSDKKIELFDRTEKTRIVKTLEEQLDLWTPKWKEIRSFINPWFGEFKGEAKTAKDYARKDEGVFDGVGFDASWVLGAGTMYGLTPRSRTWFKLNLVDAEMSEWYRSRNEEARVYLDGAAAVLYSGFSRSNLYNSYHSAYITNGVFGTAAIGLWDDRNTMFRTKSFNIGTFALGTDAFGKVNQFCRRITMTPMQMAQMFGAKNCSKAVQKQIDKKEQKSQHTVIHLIEPNYETFDGAVYATDLPFREYYWEETAKGNETLKVSGYHEFPIMCPRWLNPNEGIYGYGPGWFALAESKGLQLMTEDYYLMVEMMLKPPLSATSTAARNGINFTPGGVTIVEDNNPNGGSVRPIYQVAPDMQGFLAQRTDSRQIIKRRFFADLFMMLDSMEKGQMTAREVIERAQEKMTLIGPSIENYEDELLKPTIDRGLGIANRFGLLPPPPAELQGKEMKIEFLSPLSQAQKMAGLTGIEQGMAFIMNLAPMFPNVRHKVKDLEVVDKYWDSLSAPADLLRTDDEVDEIVAAEQQAAAAAQAGVQMEQAADIAKNLASADLSGQNVLSSMLGGGKGFYPAGGGQ